MTRSNRISTPGESYLLLRPDRVVFQDLLGQTGILQFMQSGRERVSDSDEHPLRSPDPGAQRRAIGSRGVAR